jgi:hypothetical protein
MILKMQKKLYCILKIYQIKQLPIEEIKNIHKYTLIYVPSVTYANAIIFFIHTTV